MSKIHSLSERIREYESCYQQSIISKIPLVITINGRNFQKTTALLDKPSSIDFLDAMGHIMITIMSEISGSIFAYSFNDEIIIILKNDTMPWCDNITSKIVSITSSIASLEFLKFSKDKNLSLVGDPIFTSKVFAVPNFIEAINLLILKQQYAFHAILNNVAFYELIKKYDAETVQHTLNGKSSQEKAEILMEETGIDIDNIGLPFRRGIAAYRAPKIITTAKGEEIRSKLMLDTELPVFAQDKEFLFQIFKAGKDILRF
jgi:tRNA(His) 5'-end guanylyltransferase